MNDLMKRLAAIRRFRGISQRAMAELIGVSSASIPKWELWQNDPSTISFLRYFAEIGAEEFMDLNAEARRVANGAKPGRTIHEGTSKAKQRRARRTPKALQGTTSRNRTA